MATISCNVMGTTYAVCDAFETISAQGTLAAKDLNWMEVPLVSSVPDGPFTRSSSDFLNTTSKAPLPTSMTIDGPGQATRGVVARATVLAMLSLLIYLLMAYV